MGALMNLPLALLALILAPLGLLSAIGVVFLVLKIVAIVQKAAEPPTEDSGHYTLDQGRVTQSVHPQEEQRDALPFKIPVKMEDKVALINPADILYALARDGRAHLQTAGDCLPTQFTLTELEGRLARSGFFRAHRSYLVNLQHVKEVVPYTRNSFTLILDDVAETEIPLSKSAAGELRELLGY